MECKICWSVYDPAEGSEPWDIPPGTAFADLPDFWRCPTCDAPKEQFMVVPGATGQTTPSVPTPPAAPADSREDEPAPVSAFPAELEAAFREIHLGRMRGIPIVNEALGVKAVGFHRTPDALLGVLVTPWFMNLIAAPLPGEDWSALVSGEKKRLAFPSGVYEFTAMQRGSDGSGPGSGLPPYLACSLFSPMFEFATMLQATETAAAALRGLMDPSLDPNRPADTRAPEPERELSRRELFGRS
jgi:[NiFe] hydrogenase assembly HybE family chaperone